MKNNILSNFYIQTPIGTLEAIYKNEKLEELFVINKPNDQTKIRPVNNAFEEKFKNEMDAYFNRSLKEFSIHLNPQGTMFQKKVWEKLLNVKYGTTITYSRLAMEVKNKRYARAAAGAVGRNPIVILIPCHRVVAANGPGGFSYGIEMKKFLLNLESDGVLS
jgi:methylated-DNA-[protein]-cysteine S-methyltransferase